MHPMTLLSFALLWLGSCSEGVESCSQAVESCAEDCALVLETFPSLDQALSTVLNSASGHLQLIQTSEHFYVSSSHSVLHRLRVRANDQTIVFNSRMIIEASGELIVTNAIIWMGTVALSALDIHGKALLEDCVIEKFTVPFALVSANLHLQRVNISHNQQTFISVLKKESALTLLQVLVQNHAGAFLFVSQQPSSLLISECRFLLNGGGNSVSLLNFAYLGGNSPERVSVEFTAFEGNSLLLIYLDISDAVVSVTNCTFLGNSNGAIAGSVTGALHVTSCVWTSNTGTTIDLRHLQGLLFLANSSVLSQLHSGYIQVSGGFIGADCFVFVSSTTFKDNHMKIQGPAAGVLSLNFCSALLESVTIDNVIVRTDSFHSLRGLVSAFFGSLTVRNLQLRGSGSSGSVITVGGAKLTMSNSQLWNPYSEVEVAFGGYLIQVEIRNTTFIGGTWKVTGSVFIAALSGSLHASDLRFIGEGTESSTLLGLADSDFEVEHVSCEGVQLYYGLLMRGSDGSANDIVIRNSLIRIYVFAIYSSNVTISTLDFNSVVVVPGDDAQFLGLRKSHFSLSNAQLVNITFDSFISSNGGDILFANSSLLRSSLTRVISNTGTIITFSSVHMQGISTMDLVLSIKGVIHIEDSVIENVYAGSLLFRLFGSRMIMNNTVQRNWESRESLGRFEEESSLLVTNCRIETLRSHLMQGFILTSGSLYLRNVSVSDFELSLFQVDSASVIIEESKFSSGVSSEAFIKSRFSFGAVLGCLNCKKVQISRTGIYDISGQFGAVALRNTSPSLSTAVIDRSYFRNCSARRGGAIYSLNFPFIISHCSFFLNAASETGGALDADVPEKGSVVSHSLFLWNQAKEGGAIKWRKAEIALINATFRANSADYGPNVASYGVRLFSQTPDQEVSGGSFSLVFELLDHYGALVTTARDLALTLQKTATVDYRGNSVCFIQQGVFNFSVLTVYTPPGSTQVIHAEMTESHGVTLQESVQITFRNCSLGEVHLPDRCEYCPSGYYSFHPSDLECRFCPNHVKCEGGGNFSVASEYWRSAWDSAEVLECPLKGKCQGGLNSTCLQGFTGKGCNQCASGYFRYRFTECEDCGISVFLWIRVAFAFILLILFSYTLIHMSLKHLHSSKLFLLKVLINHMQYLSTLGFLRISLPKVLTSIIHASSYVASLLLTDLPLACWGVSYPVYIRAILGSLLLPALSVLNGIVVWLVQGTLTQGIALVTAEMLFTPVIAAYTAMPLFACVNQQDKWWLFADMQEQCWTQSHMTWIYGVALPSLILNILGPVLVIMRIIYAKKGQLRHYAAIWESGNKFICWNFVELLSRIAYVAILLGTIGSDSLAQLGFGLCVLVITCVINVGLQPLVYSHNCQFFLSQASLVIVTISHGATAYWVFYSPSDTSAQHYIAIAIFVACNSCFCAVVLFCLFSTIVFPGYIKELRKAESTLPKAPHNSLNISESEPSFLPSI